MVFSAAAKHKVPLILWGDSEQEKNEGALVERQEDAETEQAEFVEDL